MRLRVRFDIKGLSVDESVEGDDAAAITHKAKLAIASRLGFLAGAFVKSMSDLQFTHEVVRRYNSATGSSCPLPADPEAFISWAVEQGLATRLE